MVKSSRRGALPRVLVIVGTRPEGIKLAPVVEELGRRSAWVETRLALTGQHTDLIDQVLEAFQLRPDWDLGIMREGQDLYDVAQGCLDGLRGVVREYEPDLLLVQGDTASVCFGAFVAFFEQTRVGHVEAGLRSGDRWRPYPEEVFRRVADVVADVHFAPTPSARLSLLAENVPAEHVHLTGNTVVDALLGVAGEEAEIGDAALREVVESGRRLVLVTAHRRESFGEPLREAFRAVREVADRHEDIVVLYPMHPNPRVREAVEATLVGHPRIRLTQPLHYRDLVRALRDAVLVLTDSGGIQEEAPTFGTPVLVMREVTERPEGVEAGVASLVGTDRAKIIDGAERILSGAGNQRGGERAPNPYGDGRAAERIADIVVHTLTGRPRETTDWEPESLKVKA